LLVKEIKEQVVVEAVNVVNQAAQDLAVDIGRGAVAGTKAIAATAQGVPPELAFQGISSPAGATSFAGPPQEDVDAAVGEMNQYENLIP